MNVIMRKWFYTFLSLRLSNPLFLPTFSHFWSKSSSYVWYLSLLRNLGFWFLVVFFFWYVYECVCVFTHMWICLIYCMAIIWNSKWSCQNSAIFSKVTRPKGLNWIYTTVNSLLQNSSHSFYGPGRLVWCQDYPKIHLTDEGLGAILSFKTFLSFINKLLVTI